MLPHLHPRNLALLTGNSVCFAKKKGNSKSVLVCPARSTKPPIGSGYKSLASHLLQFQAHGHMPMNIDIRTLDDGDGIEATLMRHHASWHKTCRLKFNQTKLERLGMRSTLEEEEEEEGINNKKEGDEKGSLQEEKCKQNEVSAMQTRSSHEIVDLKEAKCFLCDEAAGSAGLHNASTYDIDMRVRKCAMELEDSSLLAKLAPGDMIALVAKYHRRCLVALYNRARAANSERINEAHDV